ncbi:MAG: molybdenum cofactor guanylyltransferase [Mariprofundales bacterium]
MIADCTALILAGGRSRRMGQNKATTLLAGKTLLDRVVREVQPLFSELLISVCSANPQLPYLQVIDQVESQGPMVGVMTALRQISTRWLFVIACDMPFVSATLIRAMADQRQQQEAVAAEVEGRMQPLLAFYATPSLLRMEAQMRSGNRSLQSLLQQADSTIISEVECRRSDPELRSFMDIDTPEDLARLCCADVDRLKVS